MNRIFVDPGSTKTGWAFFEDDKLMISGSFNVGQPDKFERIADLWRSYHTLPLKLKIDEVHIEAINIPTGRMQAMMMKPLYYSIGAIASALGVYNIPIMDDINVPAWKAYIDWNETKTRKGLREKLKPHMQKDMTEDELAAISMGLYYVNKKIKENDSPKKNSKKAK